MFVFGWTGSLVSTCAAIGLECRHGIVSVNLDIFFKKAITKRRVKSVERRGPVVTTLQRGEDVEKGLG